MDLKNIAKLKLRESDNTAVARADAIMASDSSKILFLNSKKKTRLSMPLAAKLKVRAADLAAVARADAILNQDDEVFDGEFLEELPTVTSTNTTTDNLNTNIEAPFSPQRQSATKALTTMQVPILQNSLGMRTIANIRVRASNLATIARADAILNNLDEDESEENGRNENDKEEEGDEDLAEESEMNTSIHANAHSDELMGLERVTSSSKEADE
jgi:nucleoside 2-deoxyribosyltransferase